MKTPDYTRKAVKKYQQKLTSVVVRLNPDSELDSGIIEFLDSVENKTALIKKLLIKHMELTNERA